MPTLPNDTCSRRAEATPTPWEQQILARLPQEYEEQALHLKALVRCRGLPNAAALLRGLLVYVLGHLSFRQVGVWGVLQQVADLSDTAWRKRLTQARDWVHWLLASQLQQAQPQRLPQAFGACARILLVDATRLSPPGGTGDEWRVHTAYDLTSKRLGQVRVTDAKQSEHLQHYVLQAGDCVVADGAYGYRKNLAYAHKQGAFVVLRITREGCPVETQDGDPIDVSRWLRRCLPLAAHTAREKRGSERLVCL
jgi:hypothetical protein